MIKYYIEIKIIFGLNQGESNPWFPSSIKSSNKIPIMNNEMKLLEIAYPYV